MLNKSCFCVDVPWAQSLTCAGWALQSRPAATWISYCSLMVGSNAPRASSPCWTQLVTAAVNKSPPERQDMRTSCEHPHVLLRLLFLQNTWNTLVMMTGCLISCVWLPKFGFYSSAGLRNTGIIQSGLFWESVGDPVRCQELKRN